MLRPPRPNYHPRPPMFPPNGNRPPFGNSPGNTETRPPSFRP